MEIIIHSNKDEIIVDPLILDIKKDIKIKISLSSIKYIDSRYYLKFNRESRFNVNLFINKYFNLETDDHKEIYIFCTLYSYDERTITFIALSKREYENRK